MRTETVEIGLGHPQRGRGSRWRGAAAPDRPASARRDAARRSIEHRLTDGALERADLLAPA